MGISYPSTDCGHSHTRLRPIQMKYIRSNLSRLLFIYQLTTQSIQKHIDARTTSNRISRSVFERVPFVNNNHFPLKKFVRRLCMPRTFSVSQLGKLDTVYTIRNQYGSGPGLCDRYQIILHTQFAEYFFCIKPECRYMANGESTIHPK